jgi:hypothetical protein
MSGYATVEGVIMERTSRKSRKVEGTETRRLTRGAPNSDVVKELGTQSH